MKENCMNCKCVGCHRWGQNREACEKYIADTEEVIPDF